MRVLVTGAAGFVGQHLVQRLLAQGVGGRAVEDLVALDLQASTSTDARVRSAVGSVADPNVLAQALQPTPDVVFHLACLPGGAAEAQPVLGRQVNLDATVALLEALHRPASPPRLVYASSVAVYGADLPALVDDHTPEAPGLTYGAHKRVGEILLADAVRRGGINGCSLRLPGVVARPGNGDGLVSAFMSQLFWCLAEGRPLAVPVGPNGTAWWVSVQRCVGNLLAAAASDLAVLGPRRVALMPALWLRVEDVVQALCDRYGAERAGLVSYQPNPQVERLFAQYPPLHTPLASALGLHNDGSAQGLVSNVFTPPNPTATCAHNPGPRTPPP